MTESQTEEVGTTKKYKSTCRGGKRWGLWRTEVLSVQPSIHIDDTYPAHNRAITPDKTLLLSKGLNFCPQRHFDLFDTIIDVYRLVRNLTIKKHYFAANDTEH